MAELAYKATVSSEDIGARVRLLDIAAGSMQLLAHHCTNHTATTISAQADANASANECAQPISLPHAEGDVAGLVQTVLVRTCHGSMLLHDAVASANQYTPREFFRCHGGLSGGRPLGCALRPLNAGGQPVWGPRHVLRLRVVTRLRAERRGRRPAANIKCRPWVD